MGSLTTGRDGAAAFVLAAGAAPATFGFGLDDARDFDAAGLEDAPDFDAAGGRVSPGRVGPEGRATLSTPGPGTRLDSSPVSHLTLTVGPVTFVITPVLAPPFG